MRTTGKYVKVTTTGSEIRAYIPEPLAPQDLDRNTERTILLNDAIQALEKLDIATNLVSGQEWLLCVLTAAKEI